MQNLHLERAYVGVELPDEAGEADVLEVPGEKALAELGRIANDKAVAGMAPRHDCVGRWIVHHVVRLDQERWRSVRD